MIIIYLDGITPMKLGFLYPESQKEFPLDQATADYRWYIWMKSADYYCQLGDLEKSISFLGHAYELAERNLSSGELNQQQAISRFTYSGMKLAGTFSELGLQKEKLYVMSSASKRLARELPAPGLSTWIVSCMNNFLVNHTDRSVVESLRKACFFQ